MTEEFWRSSKMDNGISTIVDQIEAYANRFVGIDSSLHHPNQCARLHGAGMLVDAEIMRRMKRMNESDLGGGK